MATAAEISYALGLIDAYIDQIEDWEATGKYDRHFKEFIDFLKEYGANRDEVINVIKSALGFTPKQIRSRKDAEEIRELLRRTMTSDYLGRREKPESLADPQTWAEDNVSFAFGQNELDPGEDTNEYK